MKAVLTVLLTHFFVPKGKSCSNLGKQIFTHSNNCSNSVTFFVENNKELKFLIDTGASLCAIKSEFLNHEEKFYKDKLEVKGIGGILVSQGYVYLKLKIGHETFEEKFYVFDSLTCLSNGIIGENFLRKFSGIINYEENTLSLLNFSGNEIRLPINSPNDDIIAVPSRCESIYYLPTGMTEECVVIPRELCQGVFMAGVLARPIEGKIPVKILNTRENEVLLKNCLPKTEKSSEYDICMFEDTAVSVARVKDLFELLKLSNYLNNEEQNSIGSICAKFADIFHMPNDKLSVTNLYKESILLKENTLPTYVKPYRIPHSQKDEINRQISKMYEDGIIEHAQSEWSSPILLVPKKTDASGEKKSRLVIDYRLVNKSLLDIKFPLANVTDILDALSGAIYFSRLDLSQGYYQVELDRESRKYTAFTTDRGQWQMKRLPMGLKTSPSAFSRLMTVAMSGLNYDKCFVYLDDLIVFGRNLIEHNKNLTSIFTRLRKVRLKLNPLKCEFLKKQILYLGHIISSNGILPDPDKVKALKNYPIPKNSDEIKRFVAFANYYRKFIPNFAEKTVPLNKLCRKYATFEWTKECENSFNFLKNALSEPPVLDYPDFSSENEFILQTDASNTAIGAVLSNKNNKPVAYASRSLNKAETNYPTIEKELLSIFWAVRHFRPYLFGRHFKIRTDHKPLLYLFNLTDPSSRLTKFRLGLEEYDFHVEYVKGCENVTADALSRIVITSEELKSMYGKIIAVMTRAQTNRILDEQENSANVRLDQPDVVEILKKPKNSTELVLTTSETIEKLGKNITQKVGNFFFVDLDSVLYYVNQNTRSTSARDEMLRDLIKIGKKLNISEVVIIKNKNNEEFIQWLAKEIKKYSNWTGPRLCIIKGVEKVLSDEKKRIIINDFHLLPTSGHAGVNRMINNIKKYYFWSGIDKDVRKFVSRCDSCQRLKHTNHYTKEHMSITSTASYPFQKVYLDIIGPLPKDINDFTYILSLQCELTKFVEAYPIMSKDAETVAKSFVENFILRYGVPLEIATDRGSEFISITMNEVCNLLKIKQIQSTAYHHESIGALENSHKVLGAYLRNQTQNHDDAWSTWIQYWCFSYNTTVHTETKYTPFELVFGRNCLIPSNLKNTIEPIYNFDNYSIELKYRLQKAHDDARSNLIQSKEKRKKIYDKTVNPKNYKKGDMILVKNETGDKISSPCFLGPYEVLEDLTPNVKILKNNKVDLIHKNRTKLYVK